MFFTPLNPSLNVSFLKKTALFSSLQNKITWKLTYAFPVLQEWIYFKDRAKLSYERESSVDLKPSGFANVFSYWSSARYSIVTNRTHWFATHQFVTWHNASLGVTCKRKAETDVVNMKRIILQKLVEGIFMEIKDWRFGVEFFGGT